MKILNNLSHYRGVLVNLFLGLIYIFFGDAIFDFGLRLWWMLPLMVLYTWAFFTKVRNLKQVNGPIGNASDFGCAIVFLWIGHLVITALLVASPFYPDLGNLFIALVSIFVMRDVFILLATMPTDIKPEKKKAAKPWVIFSADVILAVYSVLAYIFTWEAMVRNAPAPAGIEEYPIMALLAALIVLPTRLAFMYEEALTLKRDEDWIVWGLSILGIVVSSVWVAA